jgi:uncharacterized phage protein (predicted DNA packaging)
MAIEVFIKPTTEALTDIKEHLNLPSDYNGDDEYLTSLLVTALFAVANHLNMNNDDMWEDWDKIPPPIFHALRLMIGNLYNNREAVSETKLYELPKSYDYLLSPYVIY